nr:tumor necrosis factor receptor superfamily member 25 [Anolis sagrei ordinatus]
MGRKEGRTRNCPLRPSARTVFTFVLVIPLGLLLFAAAAVSLAFFCKQRRWTRSLLPSDVESRMLPAQTSSAGPGVAEAGPPHVGPPLFLQGRSLYAVLEAVPARRWKEFVRGLGLRDGEIERVELEHPQLREQQYQMLRCWAQQRPGAAPQDLFAALEDMQLEGCAQALREALQGQ